MIFHYRLLDLGLNGGKQICNLIVLFMNKCVTDRQKLSLILSYYAILFYHIINGERVDL